MSVGHVARVCEEAGLPTVMVVTRPFRPRVAAMQPPRMVVTRHIMGRPFGAPGDAERQRHVLHAALELLGEARENGATVELPDPYRAAP